MMLIDRKHARHWVWWLMVGAPVAMTGLWLGSGREVLTKQRRPVEIMVEDRVFGDSVTEIHWAPGPIFGYYIGVDLVVLAASCSLAIAGVMGWRARRAGRRARGKGNEHES